MPILYVIAFIKFNKNTEDNLYSIHPWYQVCGDLGLDVFQGEAPAMLWLKAVESRLPASPCAGSLGHLLMRHLTRTRCSSFSSPGRRVRHTQVACCPCALDGVRPVTRGPSGPRRRCGWTSGPGVETGRCERGPRAGRGGHVRGFFGVEATKKRLKSCFLLNLKSEPIFLRILN